MASISASMVDPGGTVSLVVGAGDGTVAWVDAGAGADAVGLGAAVAVGGVAGESVAGVASAV
ncbi:hypothetical protein [Arthrobacter oryzae]|uniref:hypothetical protein n=1 Tax=Arthrobacter oryzae TaxID=409290 RepID=UPI00273B9F2A|nr:hypothetical protein [Arthrobacter oryzae]WLQ06626.1 hypothetical protein Q8Z05_00225 [Arthrobacter oryzae]